MLVEACVAVVVVVSGLVVLVLQVKVGAEVEVPISVEVEGKVVVVSSLRDTSLDVVEVEPPGPKKSSSLSSSLEEESVVLSSLPGARVVVVEGCSGKMVEISNEFQAKTSPLLCNSTW